MANLHLVTGYAGKEHITSNDQGSFNAAIMGSGEFVLERGKQFEAQVISNNTVRIFDGDLLMQGRHIRLKENTYVDLFFENGMQGYKRTDLIVVRYEKDAITDVENANLVVIKGVPSQDAYVAPEKITGDIINDHALRNDTVLYQVKFDGLGIQEPEKVFSALSTIEKELENIKDEMINDINKYIQEKIKIVDEKLKINTWESAGIVEKALPPYNNNANLKDGYPLERLFTWSQMPRRGAQPAWIQDWRTEQYIIHQGFEVKAGAECEIDAVYSPMYFILIFSWGNTNIVTIPKKILLDTTTIFREMQYYGYYGKVAEYYKSDWNAKIIVEEFKLYDEDIVSIGDFEVAFHFGRKAESYNYWIFIDKLTAKNLRSGLRGNLICNLYGQGTSMFS